jgi:Spy/CpxP family protein refolding chaperone
MRDGGPGARLLGPEGRLLRSPGRLAEDLKLTTQQREKLQTIGEDLARHVVRSRADLEIARLDLARELRRDSSSHAEVERQIVAIAKLQGDIMKAAITARLDARSVLTTDQRRQLMETRTRGDRARFE